jgi:hypothetical protein
VCRQPDELEQFDIEKSTLVSCTVISRFSNGSGEPQGNNAFYKCIDSAPDIPERGKMVPLGLDMVRSQSTNIAPLPTIEFFSFEGYISR